MDRRGFLGRMLLLGAAPVIAQVDWLVAPPLALPPQQTNLIALLEFTITNNSSYSIRNTLWREDAVLLQMCVAQGGFSVWSNPLGGIVIPRSSMRHDPIEGGDTQLVFRDLDTEQIFVQRNGDVPVGFD